MSAPESDNAQQNLCVCCVACCVACCWRHVSIGPTWHYEPHHHNWTLPTYHSSRRFLLAAPVNAVLLWSVPPDLRPFALSAAEASQHLLGDIPSPPALGWLQVSAAATTVAAVL